MSYNGNTSMQVVESIHAILNLQNHMGGVPIAIAVCGILKLPHKRRLSKWLFEPSVHPPASLADLYPYIVLRLFALISFNWAAVTARPKPNSLLTKALIILPSQHWPNPCFLYHEKLFEYAFVLPKDYQWLHSQWTSYTKIPSKAV